jgi:hypothetical protein
LVAAVVGLELSHKEQDLVQRRKCLGITRSRSMQMKIPGAVGAACLQCALPLLLLTGVKGGSPCFHVGGQRDP